LGKKGNEPLMKELNELHEQEALLTLKKEEMSYEQRKTTLQYLIFHKEKCDPTIKARGYAYGNTWQNLIQAH